MNYKQGIAPIAVIIIALIIGAVIVVGIVATQKKAPVSEEPLFVPTEEVQIDEVVTECAEDEIAQLKIINDFIDKWTQFEKNIPYRPTGGIITWPNTPYNYQFIGNNKMFIAFEDGHILLASLVEYDCFGEFTLLKTFKDDYLFTQLRWQELIEQYGNPNRPVSTYTRSVFRNGQIIKFNDWTRIPENPFVFF